MRLTYFLAVIIAATLHASGNALSTVKESNHAAILASTDVGRSVDATQADHGRLLRQVEKDDEEELESEDEERSFKSFGASLKKFLAKRTPFTEAYKKRQYIKKIRHAAVRRNTVRENIKYASS